MTLLNFILSPESVLILSDALATSTDKNEYYFVTKIFPLPHLRGVMCGTGYLDLIFDWFLFIEKNLRANDFDFVNDNCSRILIDLWGKYSSEPKATSTIYHFGFSPTFNRIKGHAFRSTNNFKKEELIDGYGFKPEGEKALKYFEEYVLAHNGDIDLVEIAKYQKQLDDEKSPQERVGIGGSLHVFTLNDRLQSMWQCFVFDDFERLFRLMLINLNVNKIIQGPK